MRGLGASVGKMTFLTTLIATSEGSSRHSAEVWAAKELHVNAGLGSHHQGWPSALMNPMQHTAYAIGQRHRQQRRRID